MKKITCKIRKIEKSFGSNKVLKSIDLDLEAGKVAVLMGANGAGKSTLVKILCGVHQADSGSIELFDQAFKPQKPVDAFKEGVVTVHQSINDGVVPDLDVASNLMLDRLTEKEFGLFINQKVLKINAKAIAETMGISINVETPVSELGVADRQLIAIARAMARKPKVLILDEPTSSLSSAEADQLFTVLEKLRKMNVAILYISHRMSDIRRIADNIITMRDGKISGQFSEKPLDYEAAVTAMIGHKMTEVDVETVSKGEIILEFKNVKLEPESSNINLTINKNEVVAITGLLGSGKSQLASILYGISKPSQGSIFLNGKRLENTSPQEAIKDGIHMSPKDRASNAIFQSFNIESNLTVPFTKNYSWLSFLRFKLLAEVAKTKIKDIGIVCQSEFDNIETLSGGNQQKVIVGRWLLQSCKLLILDEPFQGVDIKARRDIGKYIRESAGERATLVFVSELDEALEIADRVLVMHEKSFVGEHQNKNIDLEKILIEISGQVSTNSKNWNANGI
ncbi:MAG: sugar ABC transporter ATP-binding protein [Paracoccaceae bacterium]|nr:sugar ABC transporter ATP-binding protein [Paracoccaceae bacterium]